ncbi:hypothetical protein V6N12_076342 [Hibiscus sabdariffa]|uniref:Uncharacterized protein n=1 Tax=Hibiscus sabdariffa TaxID=183260 RepID=A0ABR2D9I2_9ROSI
MIRDKLNSTVQGFDTSSHGNCETSKSKSDFICATNQSTNTISSVHSEPTKVQYGDVNWPCEDANYQCEDVNLLPLSIQSCELNGGSISAS